MKARPFPVSTRPFTDESPSALTKHSYKPALTPSLKGLTGGLSTVSIAIPSLMSYKTVPFKIMLLY